MSTRIIMLKATSIVLTLFTASLLFNSNAQATIVEFQTNHGNFRVNLFDQATPQTVENFLGYVDTAAYQNTIIHRSVDVEDENGEVKDFIIQGGAYVFPDQLPLTEVASNGPILNEPVYSNVRGTIAMAKLGGDPNSASSQWFFNLGDNSASLDPQNGGFTVFGQVIDGGMETVDTLAAFPTFAFGGALASLPLANYTDDDFGDEVTPGAENFLIVEAIVVVDNNVNSAANLSPVTNTSINDDGGTLSWAVVLLLTLVSLRRRFK
ncbi:peptidylprolyl isomerase [Pleionea mediterranea]|uniref:Peptidyl-prolyl cis-trans isomerase n=1 Tax=Pleionea mediterranea TaxID=523701 RepID=A0A316FB81_9GAMM|nr:peptidylprolyl isomerase [Pleionea mediterranea]PWK43630.1 putative secreted protein [Pleionea mediterranea]